MSNRYKSFVLTTVYFVIFALNFVVITDTVFAKDTKSAEWPRLVSSPIYIKATPKSDITAKVQAAIDKIRNGYGRVGGTVVLPAGDFTISDTIYMSGSPKRFKHGGPKGIVLKGSPTYITYTGSKGKTIFDLSAPNNCKLTDLMINGNNIAGVVGIRYRAGYHLGVNGGKGNVFENIELTRMHIGIYVGDEFSPDLVSSAFRVIKIMYVDIGILIEGANVSTMGFYDCMITGFQEAGIKMIGHTSRVIRDSSEEQIPAGYPVLTNTLTGKEMFHKDVPEYAYKHRTYKKNINGKNYTLAGGGAPEVTFYNLCTHSADAGTWVIDSNFGVIRIYSSRHEGPGGLFRRSSNIRNNRFTDVFMDVSCMTPGGMTGNVIEYNGPGPFYLYGGHFMSNVALGNNTKLYQMGTVFQQGSGSIKCMVRKDAVLPKHIKRTGKKINFYGGGAKAQRGVYDRGRISYQKNPGFIQLPKTSNAKIYGVVPLAPPKTKPLLN